MRPLPFRARVALGLPAVLAIALLAACKSGESSHRLSGRARCPTQPDSFVSRAVLGYIKDANPFPQRFLVVTTGDSALPSGGMAALQDKGPTYIFPSDPAQQAKVRAHLHDIGDWTTLLVLYGGSQLKDVDHAEVRLGGRYVGGEHDGKTAAARTLQLECDSTARWSIIAGPEGPRS